VRLKFYGSRESVYNPLGKRLRIRIPLKAFTSTVLYSKFVELRVISHFLMLSEEQRQLFSAAHGHGFHLDTSPLLRSDRLYSLCWFEADRQTRSLTGSRHAGQRQ
jgi:hypothetical protein